MNSRPELSRIQQLWLMLAVVICCAPIWFWLPLWVASLAFAGLAWRAWLLWQGRTTPNRWVMAMVAALLAVGVILQYRPPLGVEPMSTLMSAGAALKFLEMRRRDEARLLLLLCYFLAAVQMIFSQGMVGFLVALLSVSVTLAAHTNLMRDNDNQYSLTRFRVDSLWQMMRLMAVSIPLMLLIFLLAPRLPSFTILPVEVEKAKTGVSDQMDPGSISELGLSNEVAFRVDFDGPVPAPETLYWRGLVLDEFDGRAWSRSPQPRGFFDGGPVIWAERPTGVSWRSEIERIGEPISYRLYLEPTHQPWLFALPAATSETDMTGLTRSNLLVSRLPVSQPQKLDLQTWMSYRHQADGLSADQWQTNTRWPEGVNPRTEALVREWLQTSEPRQIALRLIELFNREFTYTLEPPTYPGSVVDEFLFEGKAGFCEHFASAAAVALRMAGVPARVVVGYQGGEVHPSQNYLIVHQYNAHAWVEFWLPERGWVRFDPTAAVAPQRIEGGFQQYFQQQQQGANGFNLTGWRNLALVNWARLQLDSLNYAWLTWVLGYDAQTQFDFLQGLLGEVSPARIALVLALLFMSGWLTVRFARFWRARSRLDEDERLIQSFLKQASSIVSLCPGDTLSRLAQRLGQADPENASRWQELVERLERHLYAGENHRVDCRELLDRIRHSSRVA